MALASVLAQTAAADVPARRTLPVGIEQRFTRILVVAVAQTRSAELAAHARALRAATESLRVERLLATLVAAGAVLAVPHLHAGLLTHLAQLLLCHLLGRLDVARWCAVFR